MTQQFLPYAVVLLAVYLWDRLIVPILARPFRVRIPIDLFLLKYRMRRSELLQLDYKKYVLIDGAIMFGGSMSIWMLGTGYLGLRHGIAPLPPLTLGWSLVIVAIWAVVGAATASAEWNKNSPHASRGSDQKSPLGYRYKP